MPGLTDMPALSVVEAEEEDEAPDDDAAWVVAPDPAAVLEALPLTDLEELSDDLVVELAEPDEEEPEELAEEELEEVLLLSLVVLLLLLLLLADPSPEVVSPMSSEEVELEALMLSQDPEVPS